MSMFVLDEDALAQCGELNRTVTLLAEIGVEDVTTLMLGSSVGCVVQALILGSCLQLVHQYYTQPKRDSTLARTGVALCALLTVLSVIVSNIANAQMIIYHDQFTAVALVDWWMIQLQTLLFCVIMLPLYLFFALRAHVLWDRNRYVLFVCLVFIAGSFFIAVAGAAAGLYAPWGFEKMSNDQFEAAVPLMRNVYHRFDAIRIAGPASQLVTSLLLCGLIVVGILQHRNETAQINTAIRKITFICYESLLPYVLLSICFVVATAAPGYTAFQMLRVCNQLSAPVYFHGLINSLVARERVKRALQAQPVRHMGTFKTDDDDTAPRSGGSGKGGGPGHRDPMKVIDAALDSDLSGARKAKHDDSSGDSGISGSGRREQGNSSLDAEIQTPPGNSYLPPPHSSVKATTSSSSQSSSSTYPPIPELRYEFGNPPDDPVNQAFQPLEPSFQPTYSPPPGLVDQNRHRLSAVAEVRAMGYNDARRPSAYSFGEFLDLNPAAVAKATAASSQHHSTGDVEDTRRRTSRWH